MSVLNQSVIVLNRHWQAVNEITVQAALSQFWAGASTPLLIENGQIIGPVKLEEWLKLPVVEKDGFISTPHARIRRPTVIVACSYDKVPKKKPAFTLRNIAFRDGFRDGYTGELLTDPETWSLDHIDPLSRNGKDVPENVKLCHKKRNNLKGNRTPEEMGWKRPHAAPLREMPVSAFLRPSHPDHLHFLKDFLPEKA